MDVLGCTFKANTYAAAALWQEESKVEYGPNPKKGKSYDRYEAYKGAATVGEALRLGSRPNDLLFDFEKGHLKVLEPLRSKPLELFAVKNIDEIELTYTDKILARWVHLANVTDEDGKQKLIQKQVDESLRQSRNSMRRSNLRRFAKIETAKALDVKDIDSLADTTGNFETPIMATRRTHANEQAKEMLEVVEKESRAVTDFEVLQVLKLWDFRENVARQNVMKEGQAFVYSDTVGIVSTYTGQIAVKEECKRYPEFGRLLNRWLKDNLPKELGADFVYTSININKNYAAAVHRDGNNVGPSLIKAFGDFTGGELHYYPEDDKSSKVEALDTSESAQVDIAKGLLLFDGKRAHFVNDFEGERYSLVFFTCPRYERVSEENMDFMRAADFPYPSEVTMSKVTNLLRKPKGREAMEVQDETTSSLYDAPFVFWPHASPERSEKETHAEEYWKVRGIRSRALEGVLEGTKIFGKVTRGNEDAKEVLAWAGHYSLVLPSEPARKDLILAQFTNKADAIAFLNKAESEVPESVLEAGCCAVRSKWAQCWYGLFKKGTKTNAIATFGLETAQFSSPMDKEGSNEAQQLVTTPATKRKLFAASTEKSRQKPSEAGAAGLQVGAAVEVQVKTHSCNSTAGAVLLAGQRGTVKQIDGDGDVAVHFHDHNNACQWIAKGDLGNLKVLPTPPQPLKSPSTMSKLVHSQSTSERPVKNACIKIGPLQQKTMAKNVHAKEILRQKIATLRKVQLAKACTQNTTAVAEASSEGSHQASRQSVAMDGPPTKRQKVSISETERQRYGALAACFADAQIEYKADGKTSNSHPNSYQRYAAYAKATTFPEALALGATSSDIVYDFKLGVLSIINNGNSSAMCDPRFHRLSAAWRCRAEGDS